MLKWITLVEANSNNKMEKNANTENHRGIFNFNTEEKL